MKQGIMATFGASVVLVSSLFASGFAAAQGVVSSLANGTYQFRLSGDTHLCMVAHGVNRQMTIGTSHCANIHVTNSPGGSKTFTTGGKCIYANSRHQVLLDTGACLVKNGADVWTLTHSSPYRFRNTGYGANTWLKTFGFVPGYKVRVGTGGETNWKLIRQ